jgi:PKD repeat protein
MVQSQELTSGVETDLLARLIDPDGTVHPYVNLTPWKDDQYRPRVAWDGSQFVLVWQDQRTDLGGDWSLEQIDARSDLMGMRISPAGVVIDPQGFVFSNRPSGEAYPNVVASGGTTLIAGSLVRNESPFANYRIGYGLYGAGNDWPVATVSADPTGGDVPLSVNFDSAGTTDLDGTVTAYGWDFGDGETSSETSPSHSYTVGGPHVATLTVTDNGDAQTTQEVLVQAVAPNVPPVAVASSDICSGSMPLDVIFSAAGSYDPDGFTGNIHWDFGDGGEYWGGIAYHTFYEQGTWPVTLTVYDGRGGTGTAPPLAITVGAPSPPAAPSALLAIAFTADWINMTWTDNSNNEDGFKVERCPGTASFCNANPSRYAEIAQTGPNIDYHGDTGLPGGTTYSYRVRAFNVSGLSSYSNTSTATTLGGPPAAPSSLLAGASSASSINMTWTDNSNNEDGFKVERCQGTASFCNANPCSTRRSGRRAPTSAPTATPAWPRDDHSYRVRAFNASGDSSYSNTSSATTPAGRPRPRAAWPQAPDYEGRSPTSISRGRTTRPAKRASCSRGARARAARASASAPPSARTP